MTSVLATDISTYHDANQCMRCTFESLFWQWKSAFGCFVNRWRYHLHQQNEERHLHSKIPRTFCCVPDPEISLLYASGDSRCRGGNSGSGGSEAMERLVSDKGDAMSCDALVSCCVAEGPSRRRFSRFHLNFIQLSLFE